MKGAANMWWWNNSSMSNEMSSQNVLVEQLKCVQRPGFDSSGFFELYFTLGNKEKLLEFISRICYNSSVSEDRGVVMKQLRYVRRKE